MSDSEDDILLLFATSIAAPLVAKAAGPIPGLLFGVVTGYLCAFEPLHLLSAPPRVREAVREDLIRRRPIRPSPNTDTGKWDSFLADEWPALVAGEKAALPEGLPHPEDVGFLPTRLASDVGQKADWVLALPDHSRLHAHEFEAAIFVHRDKLDPARGPFLASWHWLTETREGNLLFGAVATAAAVAWLWSVRDDFSRYRV